MIVANCMCKDVVTISSDKSFEAILNLFKNNSFDAFPVVDENKKLLGVVSRTDLLKIFVPEYFSLIDDISFVKDFGAMEIDHKSAGMMEKLLVASDIMTTKIISITPDSSLFKAVALMRKYNIRVLPVVEGGKLVGVISRTDLMRAFL
ncbi:MAG: CBS domain-containing protein [bacterium]|nr:CBS domain-containing protein [bacterium]